METRTRALPLFICLLLFAAVPVAAQESCEPLVELMTGSFSSASQAAADSAYYDIRLEMVRIWPDREDAYWMYIEQAVAGMTDAPYRQRVYRVTEVEPDLYRSEVFALPDPEEFAGEWLNKDPLSDITPDDLIPREGCAVYLRRDVCGEYVGSTIGHGCASTLSGASYATSEVLVGPGRIESWDRGFDEGGVQVWGAEKGAYVFLREGE